MQADACSPARSSRLTSIVAVACGCFLSRKRLHSRFHLPSVTERIRRDSQLSTLSPLCQDRFTHESSPYLTKQMVEGAVIVAHIASALLKIHDSYNEVKANHEICGRLYDSLQTIWNELQPTALATPSRASKILSDFANVVDRYLRILDDFSHKSAIGRVFNASQFKSKVRALQNDIMLFSTTVQLHVLQRLYEPSVCLRHTSTGQESAGSSAETTSVTSAQSSSDSSSTSSEQNDSLIHAVVTLYLGSDDAKAATMARLLRSMSAKPAMQQSIAEAGAIPPLIDIVRTGTPLLKALAAEMLGVLAENHESNRKTMIRKGVVDALDQLLRDGDEHTKHVTSRTLDHICKGCN